jgi:lipoate-protein ligase A
MNPHWRLILDGKRNGYYNMAVEEAILLNYPQQQLPTLRIYGWSEPFISLGYNQQPEEVINFEEKIPFVRRITGGSAILHNQEVTYSLVCSLADLNLPCGVKASYEMLCSFLKDFYRQFSLEAKFAKELNLTGHGRQNFCFSSCEDFDLIIKNKKIGGNAQRRRKNLIFQHGNIPQKLDFILIEKSIKRTHDLKFKTTFLDELTQNNSDFFELTNFLQASFERIFKVAFAKNGLSNKEIYDSNQLLEKKYRRDDWNLYPPSQKTPGMPGDEYGEGCFGATAPHGQSSGSEGG